MIVFAKVIGFVLLLPSILAFVFIAYVFLQDPTTGPVAIPFLIAAIAASSGGALMILAAIAVDKLQDSRNIAEASLRELRSIRDALAGAAPGVASAGLTADPTQRTSSPSSAQKQSPPPKGPRNRFADQRF